MAIKIALALFAVYVLWGSNFVALKIGLETLPPFVLLAARWTIAGSILFAFAAPRGERLRDPLGPRQWLAGLMVGFFLIGGGNGLVTFGEQYETSAMTALLTAATPIWSTVLGIMFFRQRVGWPTWAGLAMGVAGLIVLVHPVRGAPVSYLAVGSILLGGLMWAAGSAFALSLALPKRPLVGVALQMLGGAVSLWVASLASGELFSIHHLTIAPVFVWTFLWLIFCAGLTSYIAFNWLLQNTSLSLASTFAYVNPVIAVFMGALLLHERITLQMQLAAAVICLGVALIVINRPRATIEATLGESLAAESAANVPVLAAR